MHYQQTILAPARRRLIISNMLAHLIDYQREVSRYWSESRSIADFISIMRVRLAQSKAGALACPEPRAVTVDLKDLGRDIHLRSHTTDISVLAELIVCDGYECIVPHVKTDPKVIVDLGANTGLAARWMLSRWPTARLFAVEPEPSNAAVLRKNLAAVSRSTRIHEACIGATRRRAVLVGGSGEWGFQMKEADPATTQEDVVEVISMDRILDDLDGGEIDILKCDIEGTERELFANCADWIDRVRLAVVECHGDFGVDDLAEFVRSNGGRFDVVHKSEKSGFGCEVAVLKRR